MSFFTIFVYRNIKNMKIRLHKLSLVSACFLTLVITACRPATSPKTETNSQSQPTTASETNSQPQPTTASETNSQPRPTTANGYPEFAVKGFMNVCVKGRGAKVEAICTCSIKEIQNKYSFDEFRKVVKDAQASGKVPDEFLKIIQSCRSSSS
jgi:hypothetical protein